MIDRTERSPRAWLAGLTLVVAACAEAPVPAAYDGPLPDVVIVLVDTLRADFVSTAGEGDTPFLSELARESVVFEDASSPAPWTLPSVASLVTGRHVAEHGVIKESRRLPQELPTLAEALAGRGYATRAIYRNAFAGPMCGVDRGYQFSRQSDDEIGGEELVPLLSRGRGEGDVEPLYLYVHNAEPHDPHNRPANKSLLLDGEEREFIAWYRKTVKRYRALTRRGYQRDQADSGLDFDAEQARLLEELSARRDDALRIYARSVREADERVASIVAALRERGRWDETLFVLLADHGEEMGEHGGWLHDQSLYQELVHVPLIVRFPGGEHGGTRVSDPASLVDIVPTILGRVGAADLARDLPGVDWWARLDAGTASDPGPRVVSMRVNERKRFGPWERSRGDLNVAVREGRWKGIWNRDTDGFELYDVAADPGELIELSAREPEHAARLLEAAREAWQELSSRARIVEGAGVEALDDAQRRNLEDLGYLGS